MDEQEENKTSTRQPRKRTRSSTYFKQPPLPASHLHEIDEEFEEKE